MREDVKSTVRKILDQTYRGVEVSSELVSEASDTGVAEWRVSFQCPVSGLETVVVFETPGPGTGYIKATVREAQMATKQITDAIDALANVKGVERFGERVELVFNDLECLKQLLRYFLSIGYGTETQLTPAFSLEDVRQLSRAVVNLSSQLKEKNNKSCSDRDFKGRFNFESGAYWYVSPAGSGFKVELELELRLHILEDTSNLEVDFSVGEFILDEDDEAMIQSHIFPAMMARGGFRMEFEEAVSEIILRNFEIKRSKQ